MKSVTDAFDDFDASLLCDVVEVCALMFASVAMHVANHGQCTLQSSIISRACDRRTNSALFGTLKSPRTF